MDKGDEIFNPGLAAALMKLDPEDGAQIMEYMKTHALLSREKALLQASVREQKKLLVENSKLKKDIEELRGKLQEKQRRKLAKALFSPAPPPPQTSPASSSDSPVNQTEATPLEVSAESRDGRRRRGERRVRTGSESVLGAEPRLDVSRLDIRVGRVLSARGHAHSLSVQEVDVGEPAPRSVVSKLGTNVNLQQLPGAMVVLVCNIKACKVRGVVSRARLLCCGQSKDSVELLTPPPGSAPGDKVTFINFPGEPDKELSPKERLLERLLPDLGMDSRGVASFRGRGFEIKGKGLCRAPTFVNCPIR